MKTLIFSIIISLFANVNVNKIKTVETTKTGILITYTDNTGLYIGE